MLSFLYYRYCRKGQWELAQNWFDYSELFETSIVSFLSLHALSRKIEVMLLSFNTSRATKSKKALKQLKKQISKVQHAIVHATY